MSPIAALTCSLPDGTLAQVAIDFKALKDLSKVARSSYGMGGTVQHGASTLPDGAFSQFVENDAVEVHLATGFQNMIYDHEKFPAELKQRIYEYLKTRHKPGPSGTSRRTRSLRR